MFKHASDWGLDDESEGFWPDNSVSRYYIVKFYYYYYLRKTEIDTLNSVLSISEMPGFPGVRGKKAFPRAQLEANRKKNRQLDGLQAP